jgi:hypothetical protein
MGVGRDGGAGGAGEPGRATRSGVAAGAFAGGLALVFATTVYYSVDVVFDGGTWWGMATRHWLIGGMCLGPALGVAGALIRRSGLIGTLAVLLVPAGAPLQTVLMPPPPESRMAAPVRFTVWVATAVATVLIAKRIGRRGAAVSPAGPS